MTTITTEQAQTIRARCAGNNHAAEQAEWFIAAAMRGDPSAPEYGANPDLVAALGHQTAEVFLGL